MSEMIILGLTPSDMTRAERRKLLEVPGAKGQGLPGFLKEEALSAIIKIRFIKLILIIKLISYLCQKRA